MKDYIEIKFTNKAWKFSVKLLKPRKFSGLCLAESVFTKILRYLARLQAKLIYLAKLTAEMQVVSHRPKFHNKGIAKQAICLKHFTNLLKESLVFRARPVAGSFLLRLKIATMWFKLNIFTDNLTGKSTMFFTDIVQVAKSRTEL